MTLNALSNGNFSRQVVFKRNGLVAPIVNLVVSMENGLITGLNWVNSCYEDQCCDVNNCLDTSLASEINPVPERNCMLSSCTASMNQCDTQVYVTWVGTDKQKRVCTSDNFRLTGFVDFGVKSYVESALWLSNTTYA